MDIELIEKILSCNSEEELIIQFKIIINRIGIQHFAYMHIPHCQDVETKVISDYNVNWISHYVENEYQHIDSTVALCNVATEPFTWEFSRKLIQQTAMQNNYWHEANEFHLKDGVSIAIPSSDSTTGFGFALQEGENSNIWLQIHRDTLKVLATVFYRQLNYLIESSRGTILTTDMSARELECAQWISLGLTAIQVAEKMKITERTVRFHLNQLKLKLNVKTKEQVIVMLAYHRLIQV
ncbi:LuxR family transcriptional regulator [Moritella sp. Urea-trap-13]|uniref:LuxR family transcriptional regulator n=1 Tax=Moritella sp. Urea-trap-13 TaxID=2058327 RepID=UPI000C3228D0|nr:LuxR family transcriptional regulator [Moritella sp. Urea-trap-13]PKH06910.1 hypothetical protein CXF93_13570 [Moritella sp. Urea-trap-13]